MAGKGVPIPRICRHFARTGQCTYQGCKFVHIRPKSGGVLAQFGIGNGEESLDDELGSREHLSAADQQGVYTWDDKAAMEAGFVCNIGGMTSMNDEGDEDFDGDPNGLGLGLGLNNLEREPSEAGSHKSEVREKSAIKAVEENLRDSLYSLEDRLIDKMAEMFGRESDFQRRA